MTLHLVLGGARSGKSTFAENLANVNPLHRVLYVATAQAFDAEMADRIEVHRLGRPSAWYTVEEPLQVAEAIEQHQSQIRADVVIVDCLTLWLSNLLANVHDDDQFSYDSSWNLAETAVHDLINVYQRHACDFILVSNEVGMGIVPPYPLGRLYRDTLGRMNTYVATVADSVTLLVAGLPLKIKAVPA